MAIERTNLRWSDMKEDDGEDFNLLFLPPKQVIGPDENGIKKLVEYKFNDEGKQVKITTTTRVRKSVSKHAAVERRPWPKFGNKDAGARLTMVSTEEILLELPCAPVNPCNSGDPLAQMGKGGAVLMVCRSCGKKGDHWTSRCPNYKDLSQPTESFIDKPLLGAAPGTNGAYVPPSKRGDKNSTTDRTGNGMRRRNDENSVKVTNLSEDTTESDLLELFCPFGDVNRAHVSIDRKTWSSRGFGFVNFKKREDAERAIRKLNGYGYDNLILGVEWASSRAS